MSWINQAFETLGLTLKSKGADYAPGKDEFQNLRASGRRVGLDPVRSAIFYIEQKLTRWENLQGRTPQNESVEDTLRDLAGYAILAYAAYLEDRNGKLTMSGSELTGSLDDLSWPSRP